MTVATTERKSLTVGEIGLGVVLSAAAVLALVIAGKAESSAYSFHAILFALAGGLAVFAIVDRYQKRPAELPSATIDGRPNYNYGPIKFATLASLFWGIA